jgi:GLPGLI family protein
MKKIILLAALPIVLMRVQAQQFINKGNIEFEVKTNVRKTVGEGMWAEMMKENLPTFKVAYYNYTFNDNKSIYKLDRFDEKMKIPDFMKKEDEEDQWYMDINQNFIQFQKSIFGSSFFIKDSLVPSQWRMAQEHMEIAGFNCHKAVGKIYDSVYVFAYYTDQITISGGPCSIHGLPGMILGMTIPRLYTSWIATKVTVAGVNESVIKAPAGKKMYTHKEYKDFLKERTKEWESYQEDKSFVRQFLWGRML